MGFMKMNWAGFLDGLGGVMRSLVDGVLTVIIAAFGLCLGLLVVCLYFAPVVLVMLAIYWLAQQTGIF